MSRILCSVVILASLFVSVPARGELCAKCKELAYIMNIGKCVECGGGTSSGAFKLCAACSAKLGQCEHCRTPLAPADKPAPKDLLPGSMRTIDQAMQGKFGLAAVCEAVADATVFVGDYTNRAAQKFKIIHVLAGEAPKDDKPLELAYSFVQPMGERAIRKAERVIWIVQQLNTGGREAIKALPDTPENRKTVAAAARKTLGEPDTAPAPEKPHE